MPELSIVEVTTELLLSCVSAPVGGRRCRRSGRPPRLIRLPVIEPDGASAPPVFQPKNRASRRRLVAVPT